MNIRIDSLSPDYLIKFRSDHWANLENEECEKFLYKWEFYRIIKTEIGREKVFKLIPVDYIDSYNAPDVWAGDHTILYVAESQFIKYFEIFEFEFQWHSHPLTSIFSNLAT